ncbi:MAG TPA: HAMP domain-containing sensor histidine kinase [Marmoricola sp.]|nr:HAMP domain-containing sensor histidine kinase [Marmoricola sp.]
MSSANRTRTELSGALEAVSVRSFFRRRSLAGRIIVLTTLAVGLGVTAVAFAAFFTVRSQTLSTLDASLRARAHQATHKTDIETLATDKVPRWALSVADVKILFIDLSNIPQVSSATRDNDLTASQTELNVAAGKPKSSARTVSVDGVDYRMVAVHVGNDQALVLAQSLAPTERMLDRLQLVLIGFGLLGVGIAGAAGFIVARDGLTPLRRLTASVDSIGRTGQLHTIKVEGHDEVARLAGAFNTMITALAASQQGQRDLVADASHELRTPLTSMRTNLDLLAQSNDRLPAEVRREILDDVRGQITEMTSLIGDLVELARETPAPSHHQRLDFAEVVDAALVRVRRRATTQVFDVHLEPWTVDGDPTALERAVTNLLDNAVKWSPAHGHIQVQLRGGTLVVIDEGPGIDPEDMPRVFDRFYRAPASRAMPGSGLGLAIVADVAQRHGGNVRVGRGPRGGAALSFRVPGADQAPDAPTQPTPSS